MRLHGCDVDAGGHEGQHLADLVDALERHDAENGGADHLRGRVAVHRLGRRVPRQHDAARRLRRDRVAGGLDDRGELAAQCLVAVALGDVAEVDDDPANRIVVGHVASSRFDPAPAAVLVTRLHLGDRLGSRHGREHAERFVAQGEVVGVHKVRREPADPLGLLVAEHAADRGALPADDAVGVDDADRVGRVVQERLEPLLAVPDLLLGVAQSRRDQRDALADEHAHRQ